MDVDGGAENEGSTKFTCGDVWGPNVVGAAAPARVPPPVACCTPLAAPAMSVAEAETTAALFKALADPARVRIVNMLATSDSAVCVCDLTPSLGLSQGTVSHHLKKLLDAGLLEREQRGVWAYYSLDTQAMGRLAPVVAMEGRAAE